MKAHNELVHLINTLPQTERHTQSEKLAHKLLLTHIATSLIIKKQIKKTLLFNT